MVVPHGQEDAVADAEHHAQSSRHSSPRRSGLVPKERNSNSEPIPDFFAITDERIIWINRKPYIATACLGRGGFAVVYKVELLVPVGTKLALDKKKQPEIVDIDENEGASAFLLEKREQDDDRANVNVVQEHERSVKSMSEEEERITLQLKKDLEDRPKDLEEPNVDAEAGAGVREIDVDVEVQAPLIDRKDSIFEEVEKLEKRQMSGSLDAPKSGEKMSFMLIPKATNENQNKKNRPISSVIREDNFDNFEDLLSSSPTTTLTRSGFRLALKVQTKLSNSHYRAFQHEVRLLRQFQGSRYSRYVAQIRDHVFGKDKVLILMDLALSDLQTFLKEEVWLNVELICELWKALVDCLAAVNEKNVIHFDLKPHNFLLFPKEQGDEGAEGNDLGFFVKLADFGVAHELSRMFLQHFSL